MELIEQTNILAHSCKLCRRIEVLSPSTSAMSQSVAAVEMEWRAQFNEMKAAIAALKLPKGDNGGAATAYGHDIVVDDSDDLTAGYESDEIWDLIDGEGQDSSSDSLGFDDGVEPDSGATQQSHLGWLEQRCGNVAQRSRGLDAEVLNAQILEILRSASNGTWPYSTQYVKTLPVLNAAQNTNSRRSLPTCSASMSLTLSRT